MAKLVGAIEPFDGEDFNDYSERLEAYFEANDIGVVDQDDSDDERQAADKRKVATTILSINWQENIQYIEEFVFTK